MFQDPPVPAAGLERPFANTYWIEPGRLLAGEYPGAAQRSDTVTRLQNLLATGIDAFVDLTEDGELPGYATYLEELAPRVLHRRFPVLDHDVPSSSRFVSGVLDNIDALLREGRRIYVHCRAGVGRTGTIIGCWLIRHGLPSEAALDRLAQLWQQSERSRFIPHVPETAAQTRYVRQWREQPAALVNAGDHGRIASVLYGMALGEAAASPAGQWSSNTAMTLILADSLLASSGHVPEDQMRRYLEWQQTGRPPGTSLTVEVPPSVRRAVATWQWTRKPYAGSHDPANLDTHSLARTAAVVLFYAGQSSLLDVAVDASRTTQQAPVVLDACRVYAALLTAALMGIEKATLVRCSGHPVFDLLHKRRLKPEIAALLETAPRRRLSAAREDVVGTLGAVLKTFAEADDFSSGIALLARMSVSSGAAACYGALLGAHQPTALPRELYAGITDRPFFDDLARRITAFQERHE